MASDSRRGVLRDHDIDAPATYSCLFGLYTKIGMGVTSHTGKQKWQRLLRLVHDLAKLRPPGSRHDYAAIMLNHNVSVSVHADRFNHGPSSLLSFGDHDAGQLWVEHTEGNHGMVMGDEEVLGKVLDTRHQWHSFDAHARHCVLAAVPVANEEVAERYSISLFCPGRLDAVPADIWKRLETAGFPVSSLKGERIPEQAAASAGRANRGRRGRASRALLSGATLSAAMTPVTGCLPPPAPVMSPSTPLPSRCQVRPPERSSTACMPSIETLWQELVQDSSSLWEERNRPRRVRKPHSFFLADFPTTLGYVALLPCLVVEELDGTERATEGNGPGPRGNGFALAAALRAPLTKHQWFLVRELEHTYYTVCRPGEIAVAPGGGLSLLAKVLELSSDLGYGAGAAKKLGVLPVELTETNMSLPEVAGVVPLQFPIIPQAFQDILESPHAFLRQESDMPERLPPWFMCVKQWPKIAQQLIVRGLCRPVSPDEVSFLGGHHLRAGLFGVEKPQTLQRRVIVDRRRRNAVEVCLRHVLLQRAVSEHWDPDDLEHAWRLLTLPHGAQLCELMCSPLSQVRCWSEDAKDYFYLLRYAPVRHAETIIGFDLDASEYSLAELTAMGVPTGLTRFCLALISPAMGDQKSMEVAQLCHQHVMLEHGGIRPDSWISYRWPFPPDSIVSGCYCDDFGLIALGGDDLVLDDMQEVHVPEVFLDDHEQAYCMSADLDVASVNNAQEVDVPEVFMDDRDQAYCMMTRMSMAMWASWLTLCRTDIGRRAGVRVHLSTAQLRCVSRLNLELPAF
eukprot:6490879-Amphidinium_carterae.3